MLSKFLIASLLAGSNGFVVSPKPNTNTFSSTFVANEASVSKKLSSFSPNTKMLYHFMQNTEFNDIEDEGITQEELSDVIMMTTIASVLMEDFDGNIFHLGLEFLNTSDDFVNRVNEKLEKYGRFRTKDEIATVKRRLIASIFFERE